jgi:hypothetical protein
MCSETSSPTDATNHKQKIELLDYPVTPIVDSILGAVLLCMLVVGNRKPHSLQIYRDDLNRRIRLLDHVDQRYDVIWSRDGRSP